MADVYLGSVYADMVLRTDNFRKNVATAGTQLNGLGKEASGAGKNVGQLNGKVSASQSAMGKLGSRLGFVSGVTQTLVQKGIRVLSSSISDAAKRADTLNNFPKVMTNLGVKTDAAKKSMDGLVKGTQGLPTPLDHSASKVQQLVAITGDIGKSTKLFLALNDAALSGGKGMEAAESATQQYIQALSVGKMDMRTWNTLQQTMPAQLKQVANAMGYVGDTASGDLFKAMQSGKVSMQDFNKKLIELDTKGGKGIVSFHDQAQTAVKGITTSFSNLKTTVVRNLAQMLTAIGSENIAAALDKISQAVDFLFKGIKGLIAIIIKVVKAIAGWVQAMKDGNGWAIALGVVIGGIAAIILVSYIPAVVALGVEMVKAGVKALVGAGKQVAAWTMARVAGVKAVGVAIKNFAVMAAKWIWMGIQAMIGAGKVVLAWVIQQAPMVLAIAMQAIAVAAIVGGWILMGVQALLGAARVALAWVIAMGPIAWVIAAIVGLVVLVVLNFDKIKKFIGDAWNWIKKTTKKVWDAIVKVVKAIWEGIKAAVMLYFNAYKKVIVTVFNAVKKVITTVWNTIKSWLSKAWNGIKNLATSVFNGLKNGVTRTLKSLLNFVKGIPGKVLGFFGNAGKMLYNTGRNMIDGLINGAGSLLSKLGKFFLDKLPGWIKGPFKKVFGIHSPSTVFAGYGKYMIQGLVNGISEKKHEAGKAIQDLSRSMVMKPTQLGFNAKFNAGGVNNQNISAPLSIYGDVNIANQKDADYLFTRLTRRQDLTSKGIVGA